MVGYAHCVEVLAPGQRHGGADVRAELHHCAGREAAVGTDGTDAHGVQAVVGKTGKRAYTAEYFQVVAACVNHIVRHSHRRGDMQCGPVSMYVGHPDACGLCTGVGKRVAQCLYGDVVNKGVCRF